MPPLPTDLRKTLENAIIAARRAAEEAARASLTTLAVARGEPFATMDEAQRQLRRGLRAKARQLGDDTKSGDLPLLTHEVAYQQWHRMLFARFLAENHLLMHPTLGVAVSLDDCAELVQEERAGDSWDLAARYAGAMLPGIFLADDPAVQVRFAPEGRQKLEAILAGLPPAVFTADDGLGWVYQFWQTEKKREVNASGRKIGGADLAPVTQLFTEDYMVRFLLENTLGAWWAARHPESPLVGEWRYLRWMDQGAGDRGQESGDGGQESGDSDGGPQSAIENRKSKIPAAGTFPGWPDRAAAITCMDPCGGSGHFVVAEFEMLRRMRMAEEGLDARAAGDAVIRDNLFMLELDPRCTQIATFALALAAWRSGGYRPLPTPNIACSGIAVTGQLEDWLRLAGKDERLRTALERLYKLFRDAPTLGSLINPADVPLAERMFTADYEEVAPLLARALARERDDPAAAVLGAAAEGVAKAAKLLAGQYTLVATNVPYLTRSKQSNELMSFSEARYPDSKRDLATAFVERCCEFAQPGGTCALVSPQNWLFLVTYEALRRRLLLHKTWGTAALLGARAFETIGGEVVNVALLVLTNRTPVHDHQMTALDVGEGKTPNDKARLLREARLQFTSQTHLRSNPDARIAWTSQKPVSLLERYADGLQGIATGDYARFGRCFWEMCLPAAGWSFQQSTVQQTTAYGGREHILLWEDGNGALSSSPQARIQGLAGLDKLGVAMSQMGDRSCTIYTGELFDNNTAVILPKSPEYFSAIWAFCSSLYFNQSVRSVDQALKVTNATLVKVPFNLSHWQSVADANGPLPEPYSNDPTQWLFAGHPVGAMEPLQVAVARLLGYHWPQQTEDALGAFADADGIVCLPAVAGEAPAAERLRALLAHAYGHPPALPDFERYRVGDNAPTTPVPPDAGWSAETQERLLANVGFAGKTLDDWLADGFFSQHCKLFHNRPFIWHIWDGRKDGFSALVNYHKLDRPALEKLTYTYLGAWITRQRGERDAGVPAADGRLVAALALQKKLVAILEGEPPYDIYVRWKPLDKQPVGWEPDLNDGVRLNIRPFVTAGVLRSRFTINWKVDRGANPDGSARVNDRHLTRAEKMAARAKAQS